ncbi:unnamed protein product [Ranitomeya imitator]|uniref:Cytochrome c oxidase subunit 5A, mitochondrial n=1 Tax=Ranitomeya imitator TaxID=111125 RepID=A0ABN9M7P6_9NEOB|nr:unnamed protein product [Ranitomeya imitator]
MADGSDRSGEMGVNPFTRPAGTRSFHDAYAASWVGMAPTFMTQRMRQRSSVALAELLAAKCFNPFRRIYIVGLYRSSEVYRRSHVTPHTAVPSPVLLSLYNQSSDVKCPHGGLIDRCRWLYEHRAALSFVTSRDTPSFTLVRPCSLCRPLPERERVLCACLFLPVRTRRHFSRVLTHRFSCRHVGSCSPALRDFWPPQSPSLPPAAPAGLLPRFSVQIYTSQSWPLNDCQYAILWDVAIAARCYSHAKHESDEEFDARWVTYFNKPDIDAWELRKGYRHTIRFTYDHDQRYDLAVIVGVNTLVGYDLVPEPKILDAALRACRRLNDFASTVRILEAVKTSLPQPVRCGFDNLFVKIGLHLWNRTARCSAQEIRTSEDLSNPLRENPQGPDARCEHSLKDKAGPHKEIYPYVIQELRPTLDELGISTPEELGLDKP